MLRPARVSAGIRFGSSVAPDCGRCRDVAWPRFHERPRRLRPGTLFNPLPCCCGDVYRYRDGDGIYPPSRVRNRLKVRRIVDRRRCALRNRMGPLGLLPKTRNRGTRASLTRCVRVRGVFFCRIVFLSTTPRPQRKKRANHHQSRPRNVYILEVPHGNFQVRPIAVAAAHLERGAVRALLAAGQATTVPICPRAIRFGMGQPVSGRTHGQRWRASRARRRRTSSLARDCFECRVVGVAFSPAAVEMIGIEGVQRRIDA